MGISATHRGRKKTGFYQSNVIGISVSPKGRGGKPSGEAANDGTGEITGWRAAQGEPEKHTPRQSDFCAHPSEVEIRRPGAMERPRGTFHRDVGDGEHAEIALAERIYRVRLSELG
jgi:hypothetical protein